MSRSEILKYPTVKQLRALVAVSAAGSFVAAAKQLHLSQPALSETIAQLEGIVGGRLIQRTTRSLQLTPLGAYVLPRVMSLLKDLERLMADVSDFTHLRRGHVDVGCLASVAYGALPQILAEFRTAHPDISLHLRDDNAAGLHRLLMERDIDFAITSTVDASIGVAFRSLRRDPFHCLCRSDHPLAGQAEVSWRAFAAEPVIGWAKGTSNRFAIDERLDGAGIRLDPLFEVAQLGTMLGMVENGVGIAAIPYLACPRTPQYTRLPLVEPEVSRDIGIATLAGNALSPAADAFIQSIVQWLERSRSVGDRHW